MPCILQDSNSAERQFVLKGEMCYRCIVQLCSPDGLVLQSQYGENGMEKPGKAAQTSQAVPKEGCVPLFSCHPYHVRKGVAYETRPTVWTVRRVPIIIAVYNSSLLSCRSSVLTTLHRP